MKRSYALRWTEGRGKLLPTKKRCLELMKVWRRSYERAGWKVYSTDKGSALIALPPTWSENPSGSTRRAITLREL